MEEQDKTTFSLDDDEIVEEEVIERDEEYDDGSDDDYEDDYDDYDEEEDYDDYEDEPEEDYDDGYSDDYYDDRLNKVLDEIAELKRGMVPATQQQPPVMQPPIPQYIYQPSAPSAGSEVVMYNEISRLRDELAKNQSSLEMQKELARIKEDMERDRRYSEAQYSAEIKRLQDKIEELLKNAESPQGELPYTETARIEGGKSIDFDRLLGINEAILRNSKDGDARIQNEISQIKRQLDAVPSLEELNRAVSAVKKAAGSADAIAKLAEDVAALRTALDEKGGAPAAKSQPVGNVVVKADGDIAASELLRQLYELKNVIGSTSAATVARTQTILDFIGEFKKVGYDVHSQSMPFKEKLQAVYAFAKKLDESGESDAVDLISALNDLIDELANTPLTRAVFADVSAFAAEKGASTVTLSMRDAAERFFGLCDKLNDAKPDSYGDYLPDVLAELNKLENNRNEQSNREKFNKVTELLAADPRDIAAIKEKLAELISVKVCDVTELDHINVPASYKPAKSVSDDTVFSKLEELKSAIVEHVAAAGADRDGAVSEQAPADDGSLGAAFDEILARLDGLKQPAESAGAVSAADGEPVQLSNELRSDIGALIAKLEETTGAEGFADVLQELRNNYLDISERLIAISESIRDIPASTSVVSDVSEETVAASGDMSATLDDLQYIRAKLDEYDEFITQIGELRNDIAGIPAGGDASEQIANAVAEINSQFDKLYEDLSNVLIESEANILGKLNESGVAEVVDGAKAEIIAETQSVKDSVNAVADSVELAKSDILADTQIIKDSILMVTDAVAASPVNDAVEQLRSDIAALTDTAVNNADIATADRQKLLDDIAFLREQAELALAEGDGQFVDIADDGEAEQDRQNIYAYLDDISAKVAALAGVPDDAAAARDAANAVSDSVSAILDTVSPIADNIAAVNDSISVVAADAANAKDAANAALDALAPITDRLSAILDKLDSAPAYDTADGEPAEGEYASSGAAMSDEELVELKDSLNTILDTLPLFPQADDVVTTRDNTYSILDNLAMMPQADDIIVTRDNVAAILDAVNALSESISAVAEGKDDAVAEDIAAVRADTEAILAALPQALAEDIAVVRDNTGATLDSLATLTQSQEEISAIAESVGYIRSRMEESKVDEQNDDIANIMQDLGLVLDKLEEYEQNSLNNKQEIIDAVTGIREEIHINELDETITAAGIDDETRDTLVTEIADIRERLSNIESTTQALNDVNATTLDDISAQLGDLRAALEAGTPQSDSDGAPTDDGVLLQTLDDINEKLNAITDGSLTASVAPEALDALAADLADIKAALEGMGVAPAEGGAADAETIQAIADELAVIREKLEADPVYDTVEEILSLREDVKAARIVDQNEVSGELESIKNELAAIASGSILDEVRALRDDIAAISGGEFGAAAAPTDGELNLVLNEIVSLRDEVFSFKDEVLNATAAAPVEDGEPAETQDKSEDISIILDELTALRADQSALGDNIDELKDAISRRTTIAAETADGEQGASASGELNVVLDEIINLKNDIDALGAQTQSERIDLISEQIEEIRALLESNGADGSETVAEETVPADLSAVYEQLENINATLNELYIGRETAVDTATHESQVVGLEDLHAEIDEIKAAITNIPQSDFATELAELREELNNVRAENERLKQENADAIGSQLAELRDAIRDMTLVAAAPATADGDTSYAALIDEMRALREQVAATQTPAAATIDEETLSYIRDAVSGGDGYAAELGEIRDEIAQLRSLTTVSAESGGTAEISALRDELAELRSMLSSSDSMFGVAEDVSAIKADVQTLKEEPDLGVMSEILALRDEFQALREEIADVKRIAGETEKESDDSLMAEIQSLRDQLFAISMANVNDTESGESNYESYNNIILDELSALRDRIESAPSTDNTDDIAAEIAQLKDAIDRREDLYDALAERVSKLNNDATNNRILEELASLRNEIANQREADLTTLNFMSEMAHLLERQNQYLSENADSKISDEIESLKAEIAASDAVAEEVAKLREVMTQSGSSADNDTILEELAELREELSREKPSKENELVLQEIARLRDELTALADRDRDDRDGDTSGNADEALAGSLSDLRDQLNEIAGIIEPETEPAPKKQSGKKTAGTRSTKAGGASASKSSPKKRGRKPGTKTKSKTAPVAATEKASELETRIDEQAAI
ncbi:MAG: hypothetical protein NC548_44990, partial [Lachnospiraceae bacterium]|nr:hypothetical protein [Lachnospiraceae bacterium]